MEFWICSFTANVDLSWSEPLCKSALVGSRTPRNCSPFPSSWLGLLSKNHKTNKQTNPTCSHCNIIKTHCVFPWSERQMKEARTLVCFISCISFQEWNRRLNLEFNHFVKGNTSLIDEKIQEKLKQFNWCYKDKWVENKILEILGESKNLWELVLSLFVTKPK